MLDYDRAARLPGGVVCGDAARLPLLGGSADAVTMFAGLGQGYSPRSWRAVILKSSWGRRVDAAALAELDRRLGELPDQNRPRPDPIYTLVSLMKQG